MFRTLTSYGVSNMMITGYEANILLFALDQYVRVDSNGKVLSSKHGYTREELQSLRDRLMAVHEHTSGVNHE